MTIGSIAPHELTPVPAPGFRPGWESPIPVSLTPLIGRRAEFESAVAMLRRRTTRLLTMTGPGGIGKTRLATEIAIELEQDFRDGVVWVSLAPFQDADAVPGAVAASLGITGVAVSDRLRRALRDAQLLIVLDNFEQVLAAAPQIGELLSACRDLQVVVTSRARLRVRGERVLPVPPLSQIHEPEGVARGREEPKLLTPQTLHSEAVTLFIERAQAVVPSIEVSEANAAVVVEICQRLDGLPLAIELAAARVSHLPLRTLLSRLDRRLPLLVDGGRDMPARLQTMRNAIAWSYDLLTPPERLAFCGFSVFDDGFRLDAAEAVATAMRDAASGAPAREATPDIPVLDLLASLVENSLVRYEPGANESPRYTLLETVREFAAEQLAVEGLEVVARQAHASYSRSRSARGWRISPDGERRLDALETERANMRAALTWWGTTGQFERRLTHVAALGGFWYARIHVREGKEWLTRALAEQGPASLTERARALVWLSLIEFLRGEMTDTARHSTEGLRLCRESGETWSTTGLPASPTHTPDPQSLRALTEAFAHYALGVATFHLGEASQAADCFEEGRVTSGSIPDPRLSALMMGNCTRSLGIVAGERGDYDEAARLYDAVLLLCQSIDFLPGIRRAQGDLAYLALQRGDYASALERFKEILAHEGLSPSPLALYDDLRGAATAAAFLECSERAVRCLAAAEALGERLGLDTSIPSEQAARDGALAAAQRAIGEPAFRRSWEEGRSLLPGQAIAQLLEAPVSTEPPAAPVILSERELEVLRLLVAGQTDRVIGDALFISHRTVEFHVSRIIAKLGVSKRSGAVAAALAAGLVEPPGATPRLAAPAPNPTS
ncbi:MAG: LuxR C-terminal-related transcriptional regulator [Thermomicrobiales bacterium]